MTIGSATVNYPVLSNLKDDAALREMTMGMAVARAAFHREVRHFAYPFGDAAVLAPAACRDGRGGGFCQRGRRRIPGVVEPAGRTSLYALPRISWDGRLRSLRAHARAAFGRDVSALACAGVDGTGEARALDPRSDAAV